MINTSKAYEKLKGNVKLNAKLEALAKFVPYMGLAKKKLQVNCLCD